MSGLNRPWQVGKRYGNSMTEVVDAEGEIVCYVPTHERIKNGARVEYMPTEQGRARLKAVLEAGR